MPSKSKPQRTKVNWKEAAFSTYSLQGKPQEDLTWHNISWDNATDTGFFLIRFAPGGVSIPHEHLAYEEFVVLEGELEDHDGTVYRAGDCVSLTPGSKHFTHSKHGAVSAVFVRGGFRTLGKGEGMEKITTKNGATQKKSAAKKPAARAAAKAKPTARTTLAGGRTRGSAGRSKRA